jgi:hypothetical protein
VNFERVLTSPEVVWLGVPIAFWGMAWFAVAGALSVLSLRPHGSAELPWLRWSGIVWAVTGAAVVCGLSTSSRLSSDASACGAHPSTFWSSASSPDPDRPVAHVYESSAIVESPSGERIATRAPSKTSSKRAALARAFPWRDRSRLSVLLYWRADPAERRCSSRYGSPIGIGTRQAPPVCAWPQQRTSGCCTGSAPGTGSRCASGPGSPRSLWPCSPPCTPEGRTRLRSTWSSTCC